MSIQYVPTPHVNPRGKFDTPVNASTCTIIVYPPVAPNEPQLAALRYARIYQNGGASEFMGLLPYEVLGYVRKPQTTPTDGGGTLDGTVSYQLRFTSYSRGANFPHVVQGIAWSGRIYCTSTVGYTLAADAIASPVMPERFISPNLCDGFNPLLPPAYVAPCDAPLPPDGDFSSDSGDMQVTFTQTVPTPGNSADLLVDVTIGAYVWIGSSYDDPNPRRTMVLFDPQVRSTTAPK
ncbi:hypothetical protein [Derxia gummosa]|uniref:Uncharacterized protein n=1 Tax=Derxia gummosa DSM 723 TaxID=1121388 RepID=A0A8B6X3D8_9BURK|nr:hypothetical protein [Derxia gummosa]